MKTMDEREIEQGYANFHRRLNRILREKDVKSFKRHVAAHPRQAGKLSQYLGLSDRLAEIEMYKTILVRSPLKDMHEEVRQWLRERGIEPPAQRMRKATKGAFRRRKRGYG